MKGNSRFQKRINKCLSWRFTVVAALTSVLIIGGAVVREPSNLSLISINPAVAQLSRQQDLWRQVYQRLPNFPLENKYISKETGKVSTDNTLASRLIRYHIYIKSRTPNYRLDWKLTLADYLGANERIIETLYPGYDSLQTNPIEGDRTAIRRLNRTQRDALVSVLVNTFNPEYQKLSAPTPQKSPQPSATPNGRITPSLPKPGDAQLLKP